MSYASEPLQHAQMEMQDIAHQMNGSISTPEATRRTNDQSQSAGSPKRTEFLHHVFARPSRSSVVITQNTAPRVTKPEHRRSTLSSIRRARPRVALHKVLNSLFSTTPVEVKPYSGHTRNGSNASSILSRPGSIYHDSLPSLELVSPGAFIFSGPSLRSAYASSNGNSASRIQSQIDLATAVSDSNGSENIFNRQIHRRAHSDSFSNGSVSILEDGALDYHLRRGVSRSMSDTVFAFNTPFDELDDLIPEDINEDSYSKAYNARFSDSVATQISSVSEYSLPPSIATWLLSYIDFSSWKSMRLTCRSWYYTLNLVAPPKFPPSYRLPTELLQQIFHYLHPKDFNAARHTCRTWMAASLNRSLIVTMLKRGGWWSSIGMSTFEHDEWRLSQWLSRECSLSSDWTGNGLKLALEMPQIRSPILKAAETDFADLASGYAGPQGRHSGGLVFITSICGQFLLVAEGGMIYVYELHGRNLRPLTSVICPRRVLAMSMDATSGRLAIAALLEGRMGLLCDLNSVDELNGTSTPLLPDFGIQTQRLYDRAATTARTSIFTSHLSELETRINAQVRGTSFNARQVDRSTDEQDLETFNAVDVKTQNEAIVLQGTDDAANFARNWINREWNIKLRGAPTVATSNIGASPQLLQQPGLYRQESIPVETGPRSIYRHLCSDNDPPRSVSICPQRRCVAFGCSAGIELHWIDALTGQDLNRWFPLTAPSDFLYFLPPRPGFESSKKLRLISSAAHRDERLSIARKFLPHKPGFERSSSPGHRPEYDPIFYQGRCDHFRAVPLSDGHHVLFTDPTSNQLYLGSDAPLGGPTKLLRKILFDRPQPGDVPRLYTAATDLSWGARVAVVFRDTVILYSVPADVLELSRHEQTAETWDFYTNPPFISERRSEEHWLDWYEKAPSDKVLNAIWPLSIRGTVIGTLNGLVELAIFTKPDITIWAFGLDGRAVTWQIPCLSEPPSVCQRVIGRDGLVHDAYTLDADDCVIMTDAPPESGLSTERSIGLDGHSSTFLPRIMPRALHMDNDEFVHSLDIISGEAWYDADGNVFMYDADTGAPVI